MVVMVEGMVYRRFHSVGLLSVVGMVAGVVYCRFHSVGLLWWSWLQEWFTAAFTV